MEVPEVRAKLLIQGLDPEPMWGWFMARAAVAI